VVACAKHGTFVWDTQGLDGPRLLGTFPGSTPVPGDFLSSYPVVDAAGERVAIANGNTVNVYELASGHIIDVIRHATAVTTIAFAAGGRGLVTGSIDGSLRITDDRGSYILTVLPAAVDVAAFLPDGRVVASDAQPWLHVFDTVRRAPVGELKLPGRVTAFRSSLDGSRLLTIPITGIARPPVLWDLQHYRQVAVLEAEHGPIFSARFSQDDTYILTPSTSGTTRVWDAATGRLRKSYFRNGPFLTDAALDPTGSFVVTAGGDGVLRFWDTFTGHVMWTLKAHQAAVGGLHFDGTDLVTRGFAGEIARWRLLTPPSGELDRMVDRVVRCLPLRFDDETRGLVEQDRRCDNQAN
jgi:WD40 repeat protein